jgi:hypothetical protein
MSDWAALDITAAVAWMRERYEERPFTAQAIRPSLRRGSTTYFVLAPVNGLGLFLDCGLRRLRPSRSLRAPSAWNARFRSLI